MWIKSQDKKTLIDVVEFKRYKSGKYYYIWGIRSAFNAFSSPLELGKYKTEDDQSKEFKAIEECLKMN